MAILLRQSLTLSHFILLCLSNAAKIRESETFSSTPQKFITRGADTVQGHLTFITIIFHVLLRLFFFFLSCFYYPVFVLSLLFPIKSIVRPKMKCFLFSFEDILRNLSVSFIHAIKVRGN